ncbi:gastrula zinc finger protein XlCGF17.1 [Ixodes scapularis]
MDKLWLSLFFLRYAFGVHEDAGNHCKIWQMAHCCFAREASSHWPTYLFVPVEAAFRDDGEGKSNSSSLRGELVELQPTIRPRHEGMYHCEFCPYSSHNLRDVTKHEGRHTGEKPFHCSVCERAFAVRGNLRIHMRTHTGEKPFRCKVCQKAFARSNVLMIHKRVHTGEKPYKCGICEKEFSHKCGLLYHERTHSGERPYKCDACGNTYIQRCDLNSHRKRVHE